MLLLFWGGFFGGGCTSLGDLLADTRKIADWIVANAGAGPVTVGVYCYLDGPPCIYGSACENQDAGRSEKSLPIFFSQHYITFNPPA